MLVIDSSALLSALVVDQPSDQLARRLADVREVYAPELLDVEILHALRRLVATGSIDEQRAQNVRKDLGDLRIHRYPHYLLTDRAWDLRSRLTPSDAIFVALAEVLELPLITCDPHIAATTGHDATIEFLG